MQSQLLRDIPDKGNVTGEVVEWSITAVLKTVELRGSGGSNPSLSASKVLSAKHLGLFSLPDEPSLLERRRVTKKA